MTILSNGHQWKYTEFTDNKNYSFNKKEILNSLTSEEIDDAYKSISKWKGYSPTPLLSLNKLSKELNLNKIFYKDENKRFDLKSFKALGGAYAVEKVTKGNKDMVVATATAGNHGRSVAWGARRLGLKCKIFISEFVSEARADAMRKLGADIIRVKGNYDASLKECIKQSNQNKWEIVQDVSWDGYKEVPKLIMAGYTIMIKEIIDQNKDDSVSSSNSRARGSDGSCSRICFKIMDAPSQFLMRSCSSTFFSESAVWKFRSAEAMRFLALGYKRLSGWIFLNKDIASACCFCSNSLIPFSRINPS